jgi:ribose 5-phosphate isomerase B
MKLIFASDHAGFDLRRHLAAWATSQGHEVQEVGAMGKDPYDYPDAADAAAPMITSGAVPFGVFVCGSGIGISIRANRHEGIRAALCRSDLEATLARAHNHANVLCLGERLTTPFVAEAILAAFLAGIEDSNDRHVRRVEKLDGPIPSGA